MSGEKGRHRKGGKGVESESEIIWWRGCSAGRGTFVELLERSEGDEQLLGLGIWCLRPRSAPADIVEHDRLNLAFLIIAGITRNRFLGSHLRVDFLEAFQLTFLRKEWTLSRSTVLAWLHTYDKCQLDIMSTRVNWTLVE